MNWFVPDSDVDNRPQTPYDRGTDWIHHGLASAQEGLGGLLGIGDAMRYASKRPRQLGYEDERAGSGDALRHLLLAAELRRTHPWLATPLLYGHEAINYLQGAEPREIRQDLRNNKIGQEIGRMAGSRDDAEQLAIARLKEATIYPSVLGSTSGGGGWIQPLVQALMQQKQGHGSK